MKSIVGIAKFLLGFAIAIALLAGGGVAVALYFVTKLTALPPKPIFPNERPIAKPKPAPVASQTAPKPQPSVAPTPVPTPATPQLSAAPISSPTPIAAAQPTPVPAPSTDAAPKPLEPGAYKARVTWRNGLSVRNNPTPDSERIGGVLYNTQVVVLGESDDKRWLKVRLEEDNTEGWVKAGNLEKVEDEQAQAPN